MSDRILSVVEVGGAVDAVMDMVRRRGGVSIAEIARVLESRGIPTNGDVWLSRSKLADLNIYIWPCATNAAEQVMEALECAVEPKPASWLVYLCDGLMWNVPIAKTVRRYKNQRWLPVTFDLAAPKETR